MKKQILLLSFLFICLSSFGQSPGFNEINGNNIRTGMHSNGSLFFSKFFSDGNFVVPYVPGQAPVSTIFASGVWMGGIDPVGNLRVAYLTYPGSSPEEYTPGPMNANSLGVNFNKVWKVTKSEIEAHIADFADGTIDNPIADNIAQWPAGGNDFYTPALPYNQYFAPYFDTDSNGRYDPNQGDYPIIGNDLIDVVPEEMLYTIFNANHPSFQAPPEVEVHTLMYAFDCTEDAVLQNTVFTRHTLLHKGTEPYIGFKFAFWQDADLGCYLDDYIGCDTTLNAFFTYNSDLVDGEPGASCPGGVNTYGDNPPLQSTKFLNQKMQSYYAYYNGAVGNQPPATTDPQSEFEHYQNMCGKFRDGLIMTKGGIGYNPSSVDTTNHAFHNDPNDPLGWSMTTVGIPPSDPRVVASTGVATFQPGQIFTLDLAHIFTSVPTSNNIETVTDAKLDMQTVQDIYDNNFEGTCAIINNIAVPRLDHIKVFPNPSLGTFNITQSGEFDNYSMIDKLGRTISKGSINPTNTEIAADIASGIYLLRLHNKKTGLQHFKKLIIQ